MSEQPPADELRRLLFECVASYDALQALLLLQREASRHWTVAAVAHALGLPAEECRTALEDLKDRGLVVAAGAHGEFRFAPATPELERSAALIAGAVRERREEVLKLMSADAMERVRSAARRIFTEVFRVKGPPRSG